MDVPPPPPATDSAIDKVSMILVSTSGTCYFLYIANSPLLHFQTPMELDDPPSNSPLVSQYGAQYYAQNKRTPTVSEHSAEPVHNNPEHNTPVVHIPTRNDTQLHLPEGSPTTAPPVYDTSAASLNMHVSPAAEPLSPTFADVLYRGVEINSPITPTQPKYDSSAQTASRRACLFPLTPGHVTPENSPNKSSDSLSGFAPHAGSVNAFSATATSNSTTSTPTVPTVQVSTSHLT